MKDYQKFVIKKNSADSKTKESEQPTENREIPQTLLNLLSNGIYYITHYYLYKK